MPVAIKNVYAYEIQVYSTMKRKPMKIPVFAMKKNTYSRLLCTRRN